MSILPNKIQELASASRWSTIPTNIQAMGEITGPDGNTLLTISFNTHRDLISEIGYSAPASCPETLRACASAVCQLAFEKAVMAAELLAPSDVALLLSDDGNLDDETFYFTVLAILVLKNALSSYASFRSNDYKNWKAEQSNSR
ncbi:MAG: hypothetical protein ACI39W_10520 [Brotaphodocola sp.]